MAKEKYQAPKPRTKTEQLKEKAQKAKSFLYKSPTGQKVLGYRKKFAEGSSIESYSAQVQRKYGGGSVKRKQAGGITPEPVGVIFGRGKRDPLTQEGGPSKRAKAKRKYLMKTRGGSKGRGG